MTAYLRNFHSDGFDAQLPFDVAVVMPSVLRPALVAALHSVFRQRFPGRIQVLIGIDQSARAAAPDLAPVIAACADIPANVMVTVMWPGYSTSVRHGGLCAARDGGTLRAVLTLLANANAIAYLDDDNVMDPEHLRSLRQSLADHDYAFSLRWFAHHETMRPITIDAWESVGPDKGVFAERWGGFIDPNTLMIDRNRCLEVIVAWTTPVPGDSKAMSADRMVFSRLRTKQGQATNLATSIYRLDPTDGLHPFRLGAMEGAYEADSR